MLHFSRSITLVGSPRAVMSWVSDITGYVNEHSSLDVTCWAAGFGRPMGTVAWSAMVESQAAFAEASAVLLTDDGYLDRLEAAAELMREPGEDRLQQIVRGEPGEAPSLGSVANVTTAQAVFDRTVEVMGFAVEVAEHVEKLIDRPVAVLTDRYGPMSTVTWITVAPDLATAEAASASLQSDAGYIELVRATKGLFLPGSGHVASLTRVA